MHVAKPRNRIGWGYLEARAEKQKYRDSLAFIIAVTFIALVVIEFILELTSWEIVVSLSINGILLLAVAMTFALQLSSMGRIALTISALSFGFLNFAPILDRFGIDWVSENVFGRALGKFALGGRILEVVLLVAIVLIVRKSRHTSTTQFIHEEVHMEPKYKFEGGQFGAVGDGASATNFTQVWNANASQIYLPALASELADLREMLLPEAQEPSHVAAIAEVAMAEKAAVEGDGARALQQLKKAGSWVWDTATKVGIGVATMAAKRALGL